MKCDMSLEDRFYGTATVGERGQVVIPAEARKKFNINSGDKLLVLAPPAGNGVVLCKIDSMREFVANLLADIEKFASDVEKSDNVNND